MTKLLISVRDANEARIALLGGVDLIDIKEPRRGSLGAASLHAIQEIAHAVGQQVPLSAALGELADWHAGSEEREALPSQLAFAKFGLAGCAVLPDWQMRWRKAYASLRAESPAQDTPAAVAVAYADWIDALAPPPDHVLDLAIEQGAAALLLDTHGKRRGTILAHLSLAAVQAFIETAARHGILSVIAGSLGMPELRAILPLRPDYVAVRGAACNGERTGELDAVRVGALCEFVHGHSSAMRAAAPGALAVKNH